MSDKLAGDWAAAALAESDAIDAENVELKANLEATQLKLGKCADILDALEEFVKSDDPDTVIRAARAGVRNLRSALND